MKSNIDKQDTNQNEKYAKIKQEKIEGLKMLKKVTLNAKSTRVFAQTSK
jgi:hypothetical protein